VDGIYVRCMEVDSIELRRAPGTCCPEPSCDHGWHGKLRGRDPKEQSLVCDGCGKRCRECKRSQPMTKPPRKPKEGDLVRSIAWYGEETSNEPG
jgi:hypothetical protein